MFFLAVSKSICAGYCVVILANAILSEPYPNSFTRPVNSFDFELEVQLIWWFVFTPITFCSPRSRETNPPRIPPPSFLSSILGPILEAQKPGYLENDSLGSLVHPQRQILSAIANWKRFCSAFGQVGPGSGPKMAS